MSTTDTDTEDDPTRALAFARALFGTEQTTDETEEAGETGEAAEQTDDETAKPTGNYVPNEGNVPAAKDNSDEQFVRILFDNN